MSQEVWDYLLSCEIVVTTQSLPYEYRSGLRVTKSEGLTQMETKNMCTQKDLPGQRTPGIDLFASRISHQLFQYMSGKMGLIQQGSGCLLNKLVSKLHICFLSFVLIERVFRKVQQDQCLMTIIKPAWQIQTWFPGLLKNSLLLPESQDLLLTQQKIITL